MLIQEYADQVWAAEDPEKRWASPATQLPSAQESAQWLADAAAAQWAEVEAPEVAAAEVEAPEMAAAEVPI
jgi:hypothetical protein